MPGGGDDPSKGRERLRVWGPRVCCAGRAIPHQGLGWAGAIRQSPGTWVTDKKSGSGWRQAMRSWRSERHNAEG